MRVGKEGSIVVLWFLVAMTGAQVFCDYTPLLMGCQYTPADGFIDLRLENDTNSTYPSALAIRTQPNGSAIELADGPPIHTNRSTVASTISTVNNSLVLISPDSIVLKTQSNNGILLEGRARLWVSGTEDAPPICLMFNTTIVTCYSTLSAQDSVLVGWWKTGAVVVSASLFCFIVGVIVGIAAYRSRLRVVSGGGHDNL